jgi:hypothetical protein
MVSLSLLWRPSPSAVSVYPRSRHHAPTVVVTAAQPFLSGECGAENRSASHKSDASLLGDEEFIASATDEAIRESRRKLLLFPQEYHLRSGDRCIVLANDADEVRRMGAHTPQASWVSWHGLRQLKSRKRNQLKSMERMRRRRDEEARDNGDDDSDDEELAASSAPSAPRGSTASAAVIQEPEIEAESRLSLPSTLAPLVLALCDPARILRVAT